MTGRVVDFTTASTRRQRAEAARTPATTTATPPSTCWAALAAPKNSPARAGHTEPVSNPDLPPDSITTLPPDGRLAAIRERYNDMAYSGPTAADRERDTIIGHLLDCLEAAERRVLERDGARATRADGGGRGVSGLDAAIRAKLAEIDDSMGRTGSLWGAEEMRAAIMAVLDRHKPGYPDGPEYEEHDEPVFDRAGIPQGHVRVQGEQIPGYWCETCREFTPCPTVRDIAKELGIEASDA